MGGNMGNATSRQKCPMRPIAQFKTPWLLCDLLFRCGGQFDLGGWAGWAVRAGMGWDVRRCVALRCAALRCVCDGQSVGSFVVDRSPYFFAPLRQTVFVLPLSLQPVFRLSLSSRLMQARLDSTGLDSGPVNNTHAAMQPRRDTRRSLGGGVVWWWILGLLWGPDLLAPFL